MNVKKDILWRVLLSISLLGLFGVLVLYFIVRIQYHEGDKWRALSETQTMKHHEIPAIRGSIYSDKEELLATSLPYYKVSLDLNVISKRHSDSFERYIPYLAQNFSQTFKNRTASEYELRLRKAYRDKNAYFLLTRNASYLEVKALKTWPILRHGRYRGGVILEERTIRKKPYSPLMYRTIGFVNANDRGAGLEASFNEELSGVKGKMLVEKIAGGYRPINDEYTVEPLNGSDLFTTLNVEIQDIVHDALLKGVERYDATFGCAILMEVKTGKIKAMANLSKTENGYTERFNHAVGTLYEPGSTAKLISAIALLKDNEIKPEDSVDIEWGITKFHDRTFEDSDKGQFKQMSFQQIFERSSNVGTAKSIHKAYGKNPEKFLKRFDELGLSKVIDIGIKGAGQPAILRPKEEGWSGTALPSISIGYSMQLTPLHIATLYNAVANGGRMMKPYLVRGVGSLGKMEKSYEEEALVNSICDKEDCDILKSFLEGVVERGTARNLNSLPFPVAGKTGTARIANSGKYEKHTYNGSFAGYFPADNPQYTCLVLINEPQGAYYGSVVAAPIFKEIARKVHAKAVRVQLSDTLPSQIPKTITGQYNDIKQIASQLDLKIPENKSNSQWGEFTAQNNQYQFNPRESGTLMPDVKGLGLRDVLYQLENQGVKVRYSGYGHVKKQSPKAGSAIRKGQTVYISLGVGK